MSGLGARLATRGYATHVLRLPGHAGNVREMESATWADWQAEVRVAARQALARHSRVVLVGHSLGGALVLAVAAMEPRLAGVVSLCPPMGPRQRLPAALGLLGRWVRYLPALRYDVSGAWAERWRLRNTHAHDWVPLATIQSLFTGLATLGGRLSAVRCPALVMCARHDHIVPMEDGIDAYTRLGSARKELLVLSRSYHLVLQDIQRELVMSRIADFCAEVAPLPSAK
jgi:carboxylesterase